MNLYKSKKIILVCMNIFLTGQPQVGKSTIINKFLKSHDNVTVGGFKTISNFKKGIGVYGGVYIIPAHLNNPDYSEKSLVGNRVLKPKSFPDNFDLKGVEILQNSQNNDLILMDEIGFMETKALKFSESILNILNGDTPVIGVVKPMNKGLPLKVKEHPKTVLLEITKENREEKYLEFEKLVLDMLINA